MTSAADPAPRPARADDAVAAPARRLWAELCALYLGLPLLLAFALPPDAIWAVMGAGFVAAAVLLRLTPGFRAAELRRGPLLTERRATLVFAALCAVGSAALVLALRPGAFLTLPLHLPELWLTVLLLYPIASAWPQEVMFRALFWRRYGALFPSRTLGYLANASLFSLAHLFLWNWPALLGTFIGGLIFSWAYLEAGPEGRRGRNLLYATLLHAIAGWALFTAGAGVFFYHGAAR